MTATSQHGLHPDEESLSAFSEQALGKRERAEVLAHLAVCGRCRKVVTLAREAGTEPAAPARKMVASNAWWKHWRLVWVPAGVAVAFAATTISFVIERADRHGSDIKIAEQKPASGAAQPSTPSPTEQAKVEPPAAAAPAPPAHTAKRAHSAAEEPLPAPAPPEVTARMPSAPGAPEPESTDQAEAKREAQQPPREESRQAPPVFTVGAMRPAYAQPEAGAWEGRQTQAEQQRQIEQQHQAEADRSRMPFVKSKAAPAAVRGANTAPPAGATQTVSVTAAPPPETPPAATGEPAPAEGSKSPGTVTTIAIPIQLPSGLAAVSTTSRGHFLLAVDSAGALFLSEDRGATWEQIPTQWTGRAVTVRQKGQFHGALYAAPAVQGGPTGGSSGNAGLAPSPTAFFELSNDKNQTWVSTDGRTWTAK
jgi:hypothetical protein